MLLSAETGHFSMVRLAIPLGLSQAIVTHLLA